MFAVAIAMFVAAVAIVPAEAQLIQGPPNSIGGVLGGFGPVDGTRSSSRWHVTFDLSGGLDTEPVQVDLGDPVVPDVRSGAGTAAMSMRYWRGRSGRFIELTANSFVNRQSLATDQIWGLDGGLNASTMFGGRNDVFVSLRGSYQPFFLAPAVVDVGMSGDGGTGESVPGAAAPADLSPPTGVLGQAWLNTSIGGGMSHHWTPRQRLSVSVTDTRFEPLDGPGFTNQLWGLSAVEFWNLTDRSTLRLEYRSDRNTQQDPTLGSFDPVATHSANAGFSLQRRISPARTMSFTFEGGLTYVPSVVTSSGDVTSETLPVGAAGVTLNLSRSWTISGSARREVAVPAGISASPFTTGLGMIQLGGSLSRRLGTSAFWSYSRGTDAGSGPGSFEATSASAQIQFALAHWCAPFASYSYYRHVLQDITSTPSGFPGQFRRQALRVGLSIWLPLYGTF